jgi:hypothetical protein
MESEKENTPARPWFYRVYETTDLAFSNPKLDPYLNVDKYPKWVVNIMTELSRQGLHLTPVRSMKAITPRNLGMNLGQKCANLYAIFGPIEAVLDDPEKIKKATALLEHFEKNKENPVVASTLHAIHVAGELVTELAQGVDEFYKTVHNAFKEALEQANYAEAVQFFQGFAQGISSPGIKHGKLAQSTEATTIYQKVFFHWQEIEQLQNVTALYDFLLKVGISKPLLGDIDRLRTLCKRIEYAPGKRGRPSKSEK